MGKYRGLDTEEGWIQRRFTALERGLAELAAARRLESASIGGGGITVKDGGSVTVENGGDLRILDAGGNVVFSAANGPTRTDIRQVSLEPVALTEAWTDYGAVNVTPPDGYNVALVQMIATAGVSFSGAGGGNVGVQPKAGSVSGIGQSQGGGAAGSGAGCSVPGSLAARLVVTPGVPFTLRAAAYANGPWTAGTGNVRFSATIIYTRE